LALRAALLLDLASVLTDLGCEIDEREDDRDSRHDFADRADRVPVHSIIPKGA
jgi:hypothetical protein